MRSCTSEVIGGGHDQCAPYYPKATNRPLAAGSAFVRPAHRLQRCLDMPPRFGLVVFTFFFEGESPLSGLGNGAVAVRFQQLPGVVMNVDFLHRHGVMLLFFGATRQQHRAIRRAQGCLPLSEANASLMQRLPFEG